MSRADTLALNDQLVQDMVLRGTPEQFDSTKALATTEHVQRSLGNYSGGSDRAAATSVKLTAADVGQFLSLSLAAAQIVALPLFADVPTGATVVLHNPTAFDKTITPGESTGKISPDGNVYASVVLKQGDTALFTKQGVWRLHGAPALRYLNWATQPRFDNSKALATTEFVQRGQGSFATSRGIGAATQLTPADVGVSIGMGGLASYSVTLPEIADVPDGAAIGFHCRNSNPVTILSKAPSQISPNGEYLSSIVLKSGANAVFVREGSVWCVYGTAGLGYSAQFASSNSTTSGYQKLPSGDIEQWGLLIAAAPGSDTVIPMPVAMTAAPTDIQLTFANFSNGENVGISPVLQARNSTLGSITVRNLYNANASFFWRVRGKA